MIIPPFLLNMHIWTIFKCTMWTIFELSVWRRAMEIFQENIRNEQIKPRKAKLNNHCWQIQRANTKVYGQQFSLFPSILLSMQYSAQWKLLSLIFRNWEQSFSKLCMYCQIFGSSPHLYYALSIQAKESFFKAKKNVARKR